MARVRVVTMQRDEGVVLENWLRHYVALFGRSALTVLDNGSTDPLTLDILSRAEAHGVRVLREFSEREHFHDKGAVVGDLVRRWDAELDYDFALPVDCDELLAVFTQQGLSCAPDLVGHEFDRLMNTDCALRIEMSLFNLPAKPDWFAPDHGFFKSFVRSRTLGSLDMGFHAAQTLRHGGTYRGTHLAYLHYHNFPFEEMQRRARVKLGERVDVDDVDALRAYADHPTAGGVHLLGIMLDGRDAYERRYDDRLHVRVPVGDIVTPRNDIQLPGQPPKPWDSAAYLNANPDVRDWDHPPLHHFCLRGWREQRNPYRLDPSRIPRFSPTRALQPRPAIPADPARSPSPSAAERDDLVHAASASTGRG